MLFAGTISIATNRYENESSSFKYYVYRLAWLGAHEKVKKLKQWNKSAGNFFFKENWTSETLCNETVVYTKAKPVEQVQPISVHTPKHLKPVTDEQFGHYLAGFIDGNGHFNSKQQLIIEFKSLDASLAYYIKKRLGYGSVKKVKNKNAFVFILVITAKKGIEKVIELINGKIRTENKLNQIINYIYRASAYNEKYIDFGKAIAPSFRSPCLFSFIPLRLACGLKTKRLGTRSPYPCCSLGPSGTQGVGLELNTSKDFLNHWLAGFSDAEASFQIQVLNSIAQAPRVEIRLNFQIDQALRDKKTILFLIKDFLGGNIGYIKSQDTYNYCSTSFGSAKKVVNYFDNFHLLSSKHINYLKWKKAYLIVQALHYLHPLAKQVEGGACAMESYKSKINKIVKLKNSMNR